METLPKTKSWLGYKLKQCNMNFCECAWKYEQDDIKLVIAKYADNWNCYVNIGNNIGFAVFVNCSEKLARENVENQIKDYYNKFSDLRVRIK